MKRRIMGRTISQPELQNAYFNICEKALQRMPSEFTSDSFAKLIRKYGVPDNFIEADKMVNFLHQHCKKLGGFSARRWKKNNDSKLEQSPIVFDFIDKQEKPQRVTVEQALQIIKETGLYKIMRRKEEWEEI